MSFLISDLYAVFLRSKGVSIDTRTLQPGMIFFAFSGSKVDANALAQQALDTAGAIAVVVSKPLAVMDERVFLVPDVLATLQALAMHHRDFCTARIIAVTGSNGKTTTKELMHAVSSQRYKTLSTRGNFNNHIGLPLMLLELKDHQVAVLEMGARHVGDIAELCVIAQPSYGCITNVGQAHIAEFGSFEQILRTKTELYRYLENRPNAKLLINTEDALLMQAKGAISSTGFTTDRMATTPDLLKIWTENPSELHLSLAYAYQDYQSPIVQTQLVGAYNLQNIAYAILLGIELEIDFSQINAAIEAYAPELHRSQYYKTANNSLILDCYNANPTSMQQALNNFAQLRHSQKIVVLGDMAEVQDPEETHRAVYAQALTAADQVYCIGAVFVRALQQDKQAKCFPTKADFVAYLQAHPLKDALILLKASRLMALETLQYEL